LLKIAQHLIVLAVAMKRGARRGAKDWCAELHGDLNCGSHQDKAPDCIENHLHDDRTDDHQCEHDERIRRSAGEDAV